MAQKPLLWVEVVRARRAEGQNSVGGVVWANAGVARRLFVCACVVIEASQGIVGNKSCCIVVTSLKKTMKSMSNLFLPAFCTVA